MNIVVLTGAGISAESNIRTFRATDGLWENHRIEDVATPEGFACNPDLVHQFYNTRRAQLKTVVPNAAHIALAKLQKNYIGNVTLITQNVDNLHERAGAAVWHMHGELNKIRCQFCQACHDWYEDCSTLDRCPTCQRIGGLRPDIVWFGEMPYYMDTIETALRACQLFVSIGTSGQVYPAAGFVKTARRVGADTLEINLDKSAISGCFQRSVYGTATQEVPRWVEAMLA